MGARLCLFQPRDHSFIYGYQIRGSCKSCARPEAHLLTGVDPVSSCVAGTWQRRLGGAGVVLVAGAVVAGVMWYDYQSTQGARAVRKPRCTVSIGPQTRRKLQEQLSQAIALWRSGGGNIREALLRPWPCSIWGMRVLANEVDAGIETYKRFMLLYGSNTSLLGLVQQRLAYAYLAKGDQYDQAVKAFTGILEVPGAPQQRSCVVRVGKIEESQSRPEGAPCTIGSDEELSQLALHQ